MSGDAERIPRGEVAHEGKNQYRGQGRHDDGAGFGEINGDLSGADLWLDGWIRRNYAEWIDKLDGAGYGWASALTGRLLPAARETSHLFSFSGASLPSFSLVSAGHGQI